MVRFAWDLKRNCSISPIQLWKFYAVICITSLTVAGVCTWRGAWYVLVFSLLELSVVGIAFLIYASHATDREHISINNDGMLVVERILAQNKSRYLLEKNRLRVVMPSNGRPLVTLEAQGKRIEVGRFVSQRQRQRFVAELRQTLQETD